MLKQYLAVAAALVTLIGCRKDPSEGTLPEGVCAVRFYSGGQAEVVPHRSKSTVPMAQGTTVGVLAYQRSGSAAADVTADIFKAMKTYVAGSGGVLTPGLTDDSGDVVAGDADGMELHNGTYDFYAYSPAMKIEADHCTVKGIGHGTDFMAAVVPAQTVSRSASDVELVFEHKCSKVRFNVKMTADMADNLLAAEKAVLSQMAVSPAADYVLGGDIAPSLGTADDVCTLGRVDPSSDGKSVSVWDVVLPKSSGAFAGDFYLTVGGVDYVLKAKDIPAMSLGKGVQYIFTAVVRQGSVDLVLNVASWDAVSGSVNAGEGGSAGSGSWEDGSGETGGNAGTDHGIVIGSWDNIDWNGTMGGNPDPVTGAVEVGSWKPVQVIVDAGGTQVADIDSWVKKTLAAQAGVDHGGAVDGWGENDSEVDMGMVPVAANCGMAAPGSAVFFSVQDRVDKAKVATPAVHIGWTKGQAYTAELLWQDTQGLIAGVSYNKTTGLVKVSTRSGKAGNAGNAVVCLKDGSTVLWSWHVWVTDYNPDAIARVNAINTQNKAYAASGVSGQLHTYGPTYWGKNPNKAIMDRNLGATAALYAPAGAADNYPTYGLFYQWGRKDPFPKADVNVTGDLVGIQPAYDMSGGTTGNPTVVSGTVTVQQAIRNPQVFYCGSAPLFDWSSSQYQDLWGNGAGKSVYDPCPEGWRVASNETWGDFNTTTFACPGWTVLALSGGRLYSGGNGVKAWYPATGYYYGGDGMLRNVGGSGSSWSYVPSATGYGCNLGFSFTNVGDQNSSHYKGGGLSVRCIQE